MTEEYQFRATYRGSSAIKPQVVGKVLEQLRSTGDLTPSRVVDAARSQESPLHDAFEWRDDVAAEEYRLIQARHLIRAVVRVVGPEQKQVPYVHVPVRVCAQDAEGTGVSREGKYVPLDVVLLDQDEYARALAEAERYLIGAERRFYELRNITDSPGAKTEAFAKAEDGFAKIHEAVELLR